MRSIIFLTTLMFFGAEISGVSAANLQVRQGYLDFMDPSVLKPLKDALPKVDNDEVQSIMRSNDTMWYDEESMVFLYQDSVEVVVGARANRVGWETGDRNRGSPIFKLTHYFNPDTFKFPFGKAAGTDDVKNVKVLNFWSPPKRGGQTMPVKWWKASSRGRWHWVFPIGTVFGEVLYQKAPNNKWYVFEIRTRKRYSAGWEVNMFRPFTSAKKMARAIQTLRPNWNQKSSVRQLVNHLLDNDTLVPHTLSSEPYGPIFEPVEGSLDLVPGTDDWQLIVDLLTKKTFTSVEGYIWKESGTRETYGPSSTADFSIVPKGYKMGLFPVNEISCNRCHQDTGRPLIDLEFDIQLYGEIWGEDRIFTWHLFKPNPRIYGTFDDADGEGSRIINPKMVEAGLLKRERPSSSDPDYQELPRRFNY